MIQPADQYARQGTESRSRALQARIAELKARLAALEAHKAVPPAPLAEVTAWHPPLLDVLDAPTVPRNPDFPGRGVYVLGGLVLGLICQAALYWLKWPKPKPLTS